METAYGRPLPSPPHTYNLLMHKLRPSLALFPSRRLASFFSTQSPPAAAGAPPRRILPNAVPRSRVKAVDAALLKENWLDSLSFPSPEFCHLGFGGDEGTTRDNAGSDWVIGVDPDLAGALALLKTDESGCSAQVFDTPHLPVLVGKRIRKRLDAKSIVQLIRSLDAPSGTTAYIEQSLPFPKDGKQGWWSGGFGYGLWIGVLVASGFSVVPIPSATWKNEFQLAGGSSTKDDSRRVATELFPSLTSQLSRKKDHGRAEALLIAAYGKGLKTLKLNPNPQEVLAEELVC